MQQNVLNGLGWLTYSISIISNLSAHYSPILAIGIFDEGLHFLALFIQCLWDSSYIKEEGDFCEVAPGQT
jgi:hypothetical protein